jgi:hypothetical protein
MNNPKPNIIKKFIISIIIFFIILFIIIKIHKPSVNLKILIVTSVDELNPTSMVWKASLSKAKGYIDLLSISSIPYDIAWIEKKESLTKFKANLFNITHSLIIIALPNKQESPDLVKLVSTANNSGIGVITDIDSINDILASYFKLKIAKDVHTSDNVFYKYDQKNYKFTKRNYQKFELQKNQESIATSGEDNIIIKVKKKKASNYIIGFKGEDLFSKLDMFHQLIKKLIIDANEKGMVLISLSNTAILRMDDPGASHKIWQLSNKYDTIDWQLTSSQWKEICDILKKFNATISIMYTPMFVDDGDISKGDLFIDNKIVENRNCGKLYPSHKIKYIKHVNNQLFDFANENAILKNCLKNDGVDLQLHGYAHITPNTPQWCNASDKYTNELWMAEYYDAIKKEQIPKDQQDKILKNALNIFNETFGFYPSTFSPPLHFYDDNTILIAKQNGLKLLHSLDLYLLFKTPIIEINKIKTIFAHTFKIVRQNFIRSGYPLVLGFHDWDFKHHPITWLENYLNTWQKNGIKRFISFKEFTAYLSLKIIAVEKNETINVKVIQGD